MIVTGQPSSSARRNIILLLSVAGFFVWTLLLWSYSMDDAFISFRYAEHLADGHGLAFNIGDKPVEGYSNFLWVLLLAGLYTIGLPTYLSAKLIGLGSMLAAGLLWYRYFSTRRDDLTSLVGPLFLVAPICAFWGLSGLELGLHSLLIAAAFISYRTRSAWLYPALALLVLSRPEGPAIAGVLLGVGWYTQQKAWREGRSYHLCALAVVLLTAAALTGFRLAVFGHLLPNTYAVKSQAPLSAGFRELGGMLLRLAPITLGMLVALVAVARRRFAESDIVPAIALVVAQALISSSVDPIMNHFFRYMIPFLPLMLAGALYALPLIRWKSAHTLAAVLILLSLMVPAPALIRLIPENEAVVAAQTAAIRWFNSIPAPATISTSDLGRIPYYTKHRFHDIYGLTSEEIGQHGFNSDRELARLPDYFAFVGDIQENGFISLRFWREKNIAGRKSFHDLYEIVEISTPEDVSPAAPGYHYIIARRLPGAQERLNQALSHDKK